MIVVSDPGGGPQFIELHTHSVEDDRSVVELLVAGLEALENGLGHVGIVCIRLNEYVRA